MLSEDRKLNPDFLSSIFESKEKLRVFYEETTGEKELEKSLIQIIKYILEQDAAA